MQVPIVPVTVKPKHKMIAATLIILCRTILYYTKPYYALTYYNTIENITVQHNLTFHPPPRHYLQNDFLNLCGSRLQYLKLPEPTL